MEAKLIYSKIPAIMADIDHIGKDRKNQSQGYNFRGIDDMYNMLHRHFASHKVFYTSSVLEQSREERTNSKGTVMFYVVLTVKFTFYAEDGSNVDSVTVGEAMDSGDKASNKAMSTALKYALMQLLLIPTEEEKDTEADSPEVKPKGNSKKRSDTIEKATSEAAQVMPASPVTESNPTPLTVSQKTQILLLLNTSCITKEEKAAMVEKLHLFTSQKAEQSIAKLKKTIKERGLETGEVAKGKLLEEIEVAMSEGPFIEEEKEEIRTQIASGRWLKTEAEACLRWLYETSKERSNQTAA